MDVKEIRKRNLHNQLSINAVRGRSDKDFALNVGISPAQINQMKRGHKNMGDSIARRLEEKLKLANGYFDKDHSESEVSQEMAEYEIALGRKLHKVTDAAMAPIFNEGDGIYYQPGEMPEPGKFAVVSTDTGPTVRRFRQEYQKDKLIGFWVPENSSYPEVPAEAAELLGRATMHVVHL